MFIDEEESDLIAEMERMDRFFDGEEAGDIPIEFLRARGIDIPALAPNDDAELRAKLRELIDEMSEIGIVVESIDHLSDRELYRYLVDDALLVETVLSSPVAGTWHISPIGGCSNEDIGIYLRYYADDDDRERWHREFGDPLPPKEEPPYGRDRFLLDENVRQGPGKADAGEPELN
jgi:hypothetical protein